MPSAIFSYYKCNDIACYIILLLLFADVVVVVVAAAAAAAIDNVNSLSYDKLAD